MPGGQGGECTSRLWPRLGTDEGLVTEGTRWQHHVVLEIGFSFGARVVLPSVCPFSGVHLRPFRFISFHFISFVVVIFWEGAQHRKQRKEGRQPWNLEQINVESSIIVLSLFRSTLEPSSLA
jgi:hypothetical protein